MALPEGVCEGVALGERDSEPEAHAVPLPLLVRESDRLPGQGWWVGSTALLLGYDGPWEGAAAARGGDDGISIERDGTGAGALQGALAPGALA